jgi:hypothetical protein
VRGLDRGFLPAKIAFPERPGALRKFLTGLHQGWNISLFHYRNHGAGAFPARFLPLESARILMEIDFLLLFFYPLFPLPYRSR